MTKVIITLVALFIFLISENCCSATIGIRNIEKSDTKLVVLSGQIYPSDAQEFLKITDTISMAVIILDSPGGSVTSGVAIGRSIRRKGYVTAVPLKTLCASSCALIWLAGSRRFAEESSFLGFHAAYILKNGKAVESPIANEFIGVYLRELGLSESAISFITSAAPENILRLSVEIADSIGIQYFSLDKRLEASITKKIVTVDRK